LEYQVMFKDIRVQFQRRAELLMLGRYDEITAGYRFPMPLYVDDQVTIIRSPKEMTVLLAEMNRKIKDRGVNHLVIDVKAVGIPRQGRLRIWAAWEEFGAGPEDHRATEVVYFGEMTARGFMVEAVEYSTENMAEPCRIQETIALSA
jgi:hypothetical protein